MSTQQHEFLYTDSHDTLVPSSTIASRYYDCWTGDRAPVPEIMVTTLYLPSVKVIILCISGNQIFWFHPWCWQPTSYNTIIVCIPYRLFLLYCCYCSYYVAVFNWFFQLENLRYFSSPSSSQQLITVAVMFSALLIIGPHFLCADLTFCCQ